MLRRFTQDSQLISTKDVFYIEAKFSYVKSFVDESSPLSNPRTPPPLHPPSNLEAR